MDVIVTKESHPDFDNLKWKYEIPRLQAVGHCATKQECKDAVKKFMKRIEDKGDWKERGGFVLHPSAQKR